MEIVLQYGLLNLRIWRKIIRMRLRIRIQTTMKRYEVGNKIQLFRIQAAQHMPLVAGNQHQAPHTPQRAQQQPQGRSMVPVALMRALKGFCRREARGSGRNRGGVCVGLFGHRDLTLSY